MDDNVAKTQLFYTLMGGQDRANRKLQGYNTSPLDFFKKRGKSIENALGTTLVAVPTSIVKDRLENASTDQMRKDNKTRMNEVAKKYGYNTYHDVWDARDEAEKNGDQETLNKIDNIINPELQAQANENAAKATKKAKDYADYRENSYVGQKINQDRGKFAGSAINTLSTGFDVASTLAGVPNGPITNAIQGGIEGLADELEQNGLENFSKERALSNMAAGAAGGLATGGLNKAIGGRSLIPAKGKISGLAGKIVNSGVGRGALSGAVGGGVGAGTSAALNGQDIMGSVVEGAKQGAIGGAVAGGVIGGANKLTNAALNKFSPETAQRMQNNAQAWEKWKNSGEDFNERLTNTLTSGESPVGEWIQGKQSKTLGRIGDSIGNRIKPVNGDLDASYRDLEQELISNRNQLRNTTDAAERQALTRRNGDIMQEMDSRWSNAEQAPYRTVDPLGNRAEYTPDQVRTLIDEYENYKAPSVLSGNSSDEVAEAMGDAGVTLSEIFRQRNGGQFDPYSRADGEAFNKWVQDTKANLGGIVDNETYIKGYLDENPTKTGVESYNESANFIKDIVNGKYRNISDDAVISQFRKLSPEAQNHVVNTGKNWLDEDFVNTLDNARTNTPAQDAYFEGKASFSDALNEFIEQGGNIIRDRDGKLQLVTPEDTPTTAGGWLKKAGKRAIEDLNNKGVGLSIKDVNANNRRLAYSGGEGGQLNRPSLFNSTVVEGGAPDGSNLVKADYPLPQNASRKSITRAIKDVISERFQGKSYPVGDTGAEAIVNAKTKSEMSHKQYKMSDADFNKKGSMAGNLDELLENMTDARRVENKKPNVKPEVDYYISGRVPVDLGDGTVYYPRVDVEVSNGNPVAYDIADIKKYPRSASNMPSSGDQTAVDNTGTYGRKTIIPQNEQNVNSEYSDDIRNMRIVNNMAEEIPEAEVVPKMNNPETEVYRKITGQEQLQTPNEPIDLTKSFETDIEGIQNRNRLQASGAQLRNKAQAQKYKAIYDSLDAKTAQRAVETNAPQRLADLDVKAQDYNEYAKTSSYINRVASDLANKSGVKVNAPDLPSQLSADNIDVVMSDSALRKYNDYIKKIVPDGGSPSEYSAGYLLEKSRELGNKAANLRGNTDDVKALRQALTDAKYILRDPAIKALEDAGVTGDMTNDMIANGLKNLGANEKVQDYYTEAVNGKAPSIADYIRRSSLFEQARDMGTQIEAERYTRSASKAPTNPMTKIWRASGLDDLTDTLLTKTVSPVVAKGMDLTGRALESAGNAQARFGGEGGNIIRTDNGATPTPTGRVPSQAIWNEIGRTEATDQGEKARTARYLANAVNNQDAQSLEDLASPASAYSTSVYDTMYGAQVPATGQEGMQMQAEQQSNSMFPATGDYWTDVIGVALTGAINDRDVEAFTTLYGMYQDALAEQQKSASSASGSQEKLTDTQRRAYAADNAWRELSTIEPDAAYNLSKIPVIGDIATFGGNQYKSATNSLATQIGYMLSGANITPAEAERIGNSYVPQPFDNETTRAQKLQRAKEIIERYKSGYADNSSDYGYAA